MPCHTTYLPHTHTHMHPHPPPFMTHLHIPCFLECLNLVLQARHLRGGGGEDEAGGRGVVNIPTTSPWPGPHGGSCKPVRPRYCCAPPPGPPPLHTNYHSCPK